MKNLIITHNSTVNNKQLLLFPYFCRQNSMRKYIPCLLILHVFSLHSQNEPNGIVNWLSFKEAQEKNKTIPKPFLIDVYTDWCGWCKVMMKTTYSNPNIAGYINSYFYPIKFNAETKDTIEFNGKKYYSSNINNTRAPHTLALEFLGQSLAYPSTVFVSSDYQIKFLSQGYLKEQDIEPFLVFMVENAYRNISFNEFQKLFKDAFYNPQLPRRTETITLHTLEKVYKQKPKKTVVFFYTNFCNTCKVMTQAVIHDSLVSRELNKYYHVVVLDAETPDTLAFKEKKHYKQMINGYPFNSIVNTLTNNKFTLPSFAILDEQLNPIETVGLFQSPIALKHILLYFAENHYKTMSWDEYVKKQNSNQPQEKSSYPSRPSKSPAKKNSK